MYSYCAESSFVSFKNEALGEWLSWHPYQRKDGTAMGVEEEAFYYKCPNIIFMSLSMINSIKSEYITTDLIESYRNVKPHHDAGNMLMVYDENTNLFISTKFAIADWNPITDYSFYNVGRKMLITSVDFKAAKNLANSSLDNCELDNWIDKNALSTFQFQNGKMIQRYIPDQRPKGGPYPTTYGIMTPRLLYVFHKIEKSAMMPGSNLLKRTEEWGSEKEKVSIRKSLQAVERFKGIFKLEFESGFKMKWYGFSLPGRDLSMIGYSNSSEFINAENLKKLALSLGLDLQFTSETDDNARIINIPLIDIIPGFEGFFLRIGNYRIRIGEDKIDSAISSKNFDCYYNNENEIYLYEFPQDVTTTIAEVGEKDYPGVLKYKMEIAGGIFKIYSKDNEEWKLLFTATKISDDD